MLQLYNSKFSIYNGMWTINKPPKINVKSFHQSNSNDINYSELVLKLIGSLDDFMVYYNQNYVLVYKGILLLFYSIEYTLSYNSIFIGAYMYVKYVSCWNNVSLKYRL